MSYLDVPRIRFGGAFYSGPGTINNDPLNYAPNVGTPGGSSIDPVWNPKGVATTYLQNCEVTSFVDAQGQAWAPHDIESYSGEPLAARFQPSSDPLLGARVDSQGKASDLSHRFANVPGSMAKLVDLDPDQQGRSAVFGLWIAVTLPNNVGGFYGEMSVPFIKDMGQRLSPAIGDAWSYNAGCGWQGVVASPTWYGDVSSSEFLTALKETAGAGNKSPSGGTYDGGLAIKLTVDLHRPQPQFQGVEGDNFCFGRVMGSIAPALTDEPTYHVIGRRVSDATKNGRLTATWMVHQLASGDSLLSLDLGNSTFLEVTDSETPTAASMGQLIAPDGWELQLAGMNWGWSGAQVERVNADKTVVAQIDAGVVSFIVDSGQADALSETALAVTRDGITEFHEINNGWYFDVSCPVARVQQDYTPDGAPADGLIGPTTIQLTAMQWGVLMPHTTLQLLLTAAANHWTLDRSAQWKSTPGPTDLTFDAIQNPTTDANGQVPLNITPKSEGLKLSALRENLGSRCNFIFPTGQSLPIGDSNSNYPISVVVWQGWTAPEVPTWDNSAKTILTEYAKIYPGMKGILDISDETVVSQPHNAKAMLNHLNRDPASPSYMPVTRDLAPSRIGALVRFFRGIVEDGNAGT